MSDRLPITINPLRLVAQRQVLQGRLAVADLKRLSELLASTDSEVEVSLDFTRNDTGKPFIKGRIHGEVSLLCQRCLEHLPYSLDCSVAVVLVQTDTEAEQIQEGYDTWLLEDERIFLPDFIEDELMLALPLVAAHTHCEPARPFIEGREEDEVADEESSSIANPFAALKNLKNQ